MKVGERIRQERERQGMSQADLAERIGVLKQTLYKYEKGIITNIPYAKIERIARTLAVTPAYLVGWEKR